MCTVLLPLGVNPIAVNKYIIYIKTHKRTVWTEYINSERQIWWYTE